MRKIALTTSLVALTTGCTAFDEVAETLSLLPQGIEEMKKEAPALAFVAAFTAIGWIGLPL